MAVFGILPVAGRGQEVPDPAGASDPPGQTAETPAAIVVVCPITGIIDPGVQVVVERAIEEAKAANAKAIIFKVDTPGGRVDSAVEIASAIIAAPMQSIAYIEGSEGGMGAISAGALISFACDDLIMSPDVNIGAAAPVTITTEGMQPLGEKETSYVRAKMRALAETNGHNADIAQAMVDKDIELRAYTNDQGEYIVFAATSTGPTAADPQPKPEKTPMERVLKGFGVDVPGEEEEQSVEPVEPAGSEPGTVVYPDDTEVVLPKGKLLTLTAKEAQKLGVIPTTAVTLDEVIRHYQLGDVQILEIEANWAEKTFRFLTNPTIAGLLLLMAMGGLYFEVKTPGFGVPGIIGVTALFLLFGSHYILGLTDVIDIVLLLSGLLLLLIELFVIPGFGIAGVAGMLMIVVGLYLSLVNFTVPEYSWDYDRLREVGYSFALALALFVPFVYITWKALSRTPLYRALVLTGTQDVAEGYVTQTDGQEEAALGLEGVAASMLRPTGRGRFNGENYMVVARGDFIAKGDAIRIVEVEGNRYVVERVEAAGQS